MTNICFFDNDFYEIYENEEDCPLKKGYLLVKGDYFLFSVDTFPDDIINLSDSNMKKIFYPNYKGNDVFDKYYPPSQFNNFSVFGTGYAFGKTQNPKEINKYYKIIIYERVLTVFFDNKYKKGGISLENYNKPIKAFFYCNPSKNFPNTSLMVLLVLCIISLITSIWKHNIYFLFLMVVFIYIIYIRNKLVVLIPQKKINKIFEEKNLNYKLSPK